MSAKTDDLQPDDIPVKAKRKPQGFACMSKEQRSSIARLGGRAVQFAGTGHRWDTKTASEAGKASRRNIRAKSALLSPESEGT